MTVSRALVRVLQLNPDSRKTRSAVNNEIGRTEVWVSRGSSLRRGRMDGWRTGTEVAQYDGEVDGPGRRRGVPRSRSAVRRRARACDDRGSAPADRALRNG